MHDATWRRGRRGIALQFIDPTLGSANFGGILDCSVQTFWAQPLRFLKARLDNEVQIHGYFATHTWSNGCLLNYHLTSLARPC